MNRSCADTSIVLCFLQSYSPYQYSSDTIVIFVWRAGPSEWPSEYLAFGKGSANGMPSWHVRSRIGDRDVKLEQRYVICGEAVL